MHLSIYVKAGVNSEGKGSYPLIVVCSFFFKNKLDFATFVEGSERFTDISTKKEDKNTEEMHATFCATAMNLELSILINL